MARQAVVPEELKRAPFTLDDARRAGLTKRQLQGPSWRRLGRGIYVWVGLPESPELVLAAVLRRLPAQSVFSGRTAAWLHGLDLPPCEPIEVTIPPSCTVAARAGVSLRRADLRNGEVVRRRGLPVTSAGRTFAELGGRPPLVEAVVALDMALHRHLVDRSRLQAYAAARPARIGMARLRRALQFAEPASESPMETRLRLLLVLAGLPPPRAQVRLYDERGRFVARPDLYYPAQRLALEYDGGTHRDTLQQDNRRQNQLVDAGFRVLRFTAADVLRTPESVIALVRGALATPSDESSVPLSRTARNSRA